MTTAPSISIADDSRGPRPRGRLWPGWAILGVAAAAIAYLQIVGFVDNGTSNGISAIVLLLGLVLLGVWTALFAPFSRSARWWCIAAGLAFVVLLTQAVRI